MKNILEQFSREIEDLALDTVMLDSDDVSGLGKALASLESLMDLSQKLNEKTLSSVLQAMKTFIEGAILGNAPDLLPLEEGISTLQNICRKLKNNETFEEDLSPFFMRLAGQKVEQPRVNPEQKDNPDTDEMIHINDIEAKDDENTAPEAKKKQKSVQILEDEDREILSDFVAESIENLSTIEVELMELEQDPNDLDTINAIFRPFHTVKGVSGFLNFNKINKLSHITENLLDLTRNGELTIDGEIVDLILDSVDQLKQMIQNVQSSLRTASPNEGNVDTEPLIKKIEYVIRQIESGEKPVLGEMLVHKGTVSETDVESALEYQRKGLEKKIGEILVETKKAKTKEIVSALRDQKRYSGSSTLQVKVDTVKLDNIVDMVGELAIAQSMLRQNELVKANSNRKLFQITSQLTLITSSLQNTAMSLRMVPIKNTFQKMLRLVRDLAKKAGKEVQLVMSGEDTAIDRNMVEEIYEPMVHMIRNSIDHGLETPEEREKNHKPKEGVIHLKAYHKGGDIVIEIEDDGRGLNREKILKKAIATGLVKEDEQLTSGEIDNLIFHPGFSTADKITDISGRGVGTDVVKSKIEKLRGRVDVQSVSHKGTTFFVRLPLTLAIVDGMIIRVSDERYIIPTLNIQESFRPLEADYFTLKGEGEMIQVRDNLIPLIRLDQLLRLNGGSNGHKDKKPWERLVVVVENQERKMCLLVDELVSQEEIVIKNLGGWLKDVKGIAGSTIMGDGKVGLILDISEIFNMTSRES